MIGHFEDDKRKETMKIFLRKITNKEKEVVVFCVGTDRCTGDSLGPLVGENLKKRKDRTNKIKIYGDLKHPIHAKNFNEKVEEVKRKHPDAFIIAVDATLGDKKDIGFVFLKQGSLDAGSALSKELKPIGHMYIGGIVNSVEGDVVESLQNTRLYYVMKMAEYIEDIIEAIEKDDC